MGKAFDSCVGVGDMVPRANRDVRCPFCVSRNFFISRRKNEREKKISIVRRGGSDDFAKKENDTSSTELNEQWLPKNSRYCVILQGDF